jgi:hypothetical protein
MEKRKRAPGGGRRPGEFGKLEAVMSLRLPAKLKAKLERAAKESGRSLSGEMIWQLTSALGRESVRDKYWKVYQTVHKLDSTVETLGSSLAEVKRELGLKSKGRK